MRIFLGIQGYSLQPSVVFVVWETFPLFYASTMTKTASKCVEQVLFSLRRGRCHDSGEYTLQAGIHTDMCVRNKHRLKSSTCTFQDHPNGHEFCETFWEQPVFSEVSMPVCAKWLREKLFEFRNISTTCFKMESEFFTVDKKTNNARSYPRLFRTSLHEWLQTVRVWLWQISIQNPFCFEKWAQLKRIHDKSHGEKRTKLTGGRDSENETIFSWIRLKI